MWGLRLRSGEGFNAGALIIRRGFWGIYIRTIPGNPQNSIGSIGNYWGPYIRVQGLGRFLYWGVLVLRGRDGILL